MRNLFPDERDYDRWDLRDVVSFRMWRRRPVPTSSRHESLKMSRGSSGRLLLKVNGERHFRSTN